MKPGMWTGGVVLALVSVAFAQPRGTGRSAPESEQHPPLAKTEAEKRILATLGDVVRAGKLHLNVPAADGRMLRVLAEAVNARNVVEIGWFCLALEKTGGKLNTFELDPGRAATARANFKKAGVDRLATIVEGDAHQNITRLQDPIDVVFIDADKEGYVDYLRKLLPLVRPGGLILAHNVDMVPDYMKAVRTDPDLETLVYTQGGGLAVTLKKR